MLGDPSLCPYSQPWSMSAQSSELCPQDPFPPGDEWASLWLTVGLKRGRFCGTIPAPGPLPGPLTINENDLDHGDDEEGQSIHLYLHQDGSHQEHQQDGHQAAQDPNSLGDPAREARAAERSGLARASGREYRTQEGWGWA